MGPIEQAAKLQLLAIASMDAHSIMQNLPDDLALDPEIANEKLRAMNLMHHELKRVHYHANLAIVQSEDWPAPQVISDQLNNGLQSLIGEVGGDSALGKALQAVFGAVIGQITETSNQPIP